MTLNSVTASLKSLFRMSLLKGSTQSVLLHIRRGAPVNGRDDRDLTPLMLAASAGRLDVCLLLLEEGADPSSVTGRGQTASDMAMNAGHSELGETLRSARSTPPPPGPVAITAHENRRAVTGAETSGENAIGGVSAVFSGALADDDWETEEAFRPVVDDTSVASAMRQVQAVLATPRGENDDASWQDISVVLPSSTDGCRNAVSPEISATLKKAIATGRIPALAARRAARRFEGLEAILEDLGVRLESAFETSISEGGSPGCLSAEDRDRFADAAELVEALAAGRSASEYYEQEVRRLPGVDRAAEQSMFRAMAEAKRQVIRSLITCVPAVKDMLRSELASAAPDQTDEGDRDDDAAEDAAAADGLDGTLLPALLAVRDGEWSADVESLAEIDLDFSVVEAVSRALELTAQGAEAAARLRLSGDRYLAVRDRVIEANLPLVLKTAPRFLRPSVDLADLIQDGNIGLMRAVERFDVTRGHRFATFAVWWIRQACTRTREELSRTVRLPMHVVETCERIAHVRNALTVELGRVPCPEEIACEAAVPLEKIRRLTKVWRRTISLEDRRLGDYAVRIPDEEGPDAFMHTLSNERRRIVSESLGTLPPRLERIMRSRFGLGGADDQTLEEVGDQLGVTRERVRQLEHKSLVSLGWPGGVCRRRLRQLL